MRRSWTLLLIVLLALAVCVPAVAVAQLHCYGGKCGCNPMYPRDYCYDSWHPGQTITMVVVGVCDGNPANYSNFLMPPGWQWVLQTTGMLDDGFTRKGGISQPSGQCSFCIRFYDPTGAGVANGVRVGFNHGTGSAHDVEWEIGPNLAWCNWAKPVGMGEGPVHSPEP